MVSFTNSGVIGNLMRRNMCFSAAIVIERLTDSNRTRINAAHVIVYSYCMAVWGIVKTAAPRCRGQLDALLPEAEDNGASSCPRYRGAVVLSIPPNSHEISVLLPNQ